MLNRLTGGTLLDKILNEYTRKKSKVTPIAEKIEDRRLQCLALDLFPFHYADTGSAFDLGFNFSPDSTLIFDICFYDVGCELDSSHDPALTSDYGPSLSSDP
ncbi:hypothetical protein EVAR_14653_1 [Eumeta japonica]|uniref:Uncharacterized protein n=1 Tax=Eumeta variegata TaxID=151549 RepID=A0A4C1U2X0_EUMVA|nr:hypothetical protein EVAR_14653_1 [Eumeta japonica]